MSSFFNNEIDSDPELNTTIGLLETISEVSHVDDPGLNTTDEVNDIMNSGNEELFHLIKSIHDSNDATIKAIDAAANVQVKHFKYNAPPKINEDGSSFTFKLEVTPDIDPAKKLVSEWSKELDLINIFDIFNLKIVYAGRTYDDLKRLNEEMFDSVKRYNMLNVLTYDERRKGREELKKFALNFQNIQEHINQVHSLCKDQPNKSNEFEDLFSKANALLIQAFGGGCRYSPMINWISKWIPFVTISMNVTLCKWLGCISDKRWTLKYKASVDGFCASQFHSKCDGISRLLIVIQSDKDYVFGGYTGRASFNSTVNGAFIYPPYSGGYISTAGGLQPFLFSLINPSCTEPLKCELKDPSSSVLFGDPYYSATFGASNSGLDLYICSNSHCSSNSVVDLGKSYAAPPGGAHMFTGARDRWTVKEILAFQIPEWC